MFLINFGKKQVKGTWQISRMIIIHKECIKIVEENKITKFENQFSFTKSGFVSSRYSENVIMRNVFFCRMNKELTVELYVLPQAKMP